METLMTEKWPQAGRIVLMAALTLAGSLLTPDFQLPLISVHIVWSFIFAVPVALAYGLRGGLLVALLGVAPVPFLLWPNNGWANLAGAGEYVFWLSWLGWCADRQRQGAGLWSHPLLAQLAMLPVYLLVFLLLFPLLLSCNPPPWRVETVVSLPDGLLGGLVVKDAFALFMCLLGGLCLLKLPPVRRLLGLEIPESYRLNGWIAASVAGSFLVLWLVMIALDTLMIGLPAVGGLIRPASPYELIGLFVFLIACLGAILAICTFSEYNLTIASRLRASEQSLQTANEHLKNEEGRLRLIVDSVPLALVVVGQEDGVVISANRTALDMFALEEQRVSGLPALDLYLDRGDGQRFLDILRRDGVIADFETQMRAGGGVIWASLSSRRISLDGRDCLLTACQNISARKTAEASAGVMAKELATSNAELEQFAYVASHDLQEPLRMIASYVQLLERRYADKLDDDAREYINYSVDGAKRMQSLITDLLEFSRVTRRGNPFQPVSLDQVFDDAMANLALSRRETNAQVTHGPLPQVNGDAQQLARLFQNLIGNAIKYHHPDRRPEIEVAAERVEDSWEIRFTDNGIGIDPAYFDRIFIIFQRLHTRVRYPGTGIGLALCKKIVERHGGAIRVESVEGQGTSFIVTLPAL